MKQFLAASALLALATIAQGSTLSVDCLSIAAAGPSPIANGSGVTACPGIAAPAGNAITSITLRYQYDATFGFATGQVDMYHDVLDPALDGFDNLTPTTVEKNVRPVDDFITISNPTEAMILALAAGPQIQGFRENGSGAVTGTTHAFVWEIEYSEVPEPATYAMMAAGLVALGVFRKRV